MGQSSLGAGEHQNMALRARDGLYSILDYFGSKMNEMVYAHTFSENVDALSSEMAGNLGRTLTNAEILGIEEKAHFTARAYMERVMFTNVTYGGEDFLRNLIMFLPAYRQFATYWAPYLAKHPLALSVVYRANRDKEKMKVHAYGQEFNLTSMSFLINQSDTKDHPWKALTGWLPSGAPLITVPVSIGAHFTMGSKSSPWGELAGNWPFEFAGEYTALNSPVDKIVYGALGVTLPWPLGSDREKNLYYAMQIQNEALRKHDTQISEGDALWKVRMNKLREGMWNFLVPVRMRVDDNDVQNMMTGRRDYTAAQTPEEIAEVLNRPEMALFRTFLEWEKLPAYEKTAFAALHPEIAVFAVSGYSAGENPNGATGFLYSDIQRFGVPDPGGYVGRVDDWQVRIDKVVDAEKFRQRKADEEAWWYDYKARAAQTPGMAHQLDRLQVEWETSTGAFSANAGVTGDNAFYMQGKRGLAYYAKNLEGKYNGITDPYTGITYRPGQPAGDAYRYAKFLDQMGGASRLYLQSSPNYEMYVLAKVTEQQDNVQSVITDLTEQRMVSRMTDKQIRGLGYSEKDVTFLSGVVRSLDNLWNASDKIVSGYTGGYTSSPGRVQRKLAIEAQNRMIHSSPLTERFFGDNIAALYGDTALTTPVWEREDLVRLDKLDAAEKEMFLHLTTELDPETGVPRLKVPYLPGTKEQLIQNATILSYIPVVKNGRTTWLARVRVGDVGGRGGIGATGVVGTIPSKPPDATVTTIQMNFKQAEKFFSDAYRSVPKNLAGVEAWRAQLKAAKVPAWAEGMIEEKMRVESWKSWLAAATAARVELRDTINTGYGDAPGMSPATGMGTDWKSSLLNYGVVLGQMSPAFKTEWERYNKDNEMLNSILDWRL